MMILFVLTLVSVIAMAVCIYYIYGNDNFI